MQNKQGFYSKMQEINGFLRHLLHVRSLVGTNVSHQEILELLIDLNAAVFCAISG